MKTEKNILIAFTLNITFSIFEFFGGLFTNSVAILSDAIHDMGDAFSIGVSYILERKSKKKADKEHTYGYVRYSVLGGVITTTILLVGSILVIISAVKRIFVPVAINYSGMVIFAGGGGIRNF
jgi:cobalt-zinc-cadmium efflux system protein